MLTVKKLNAYLGLLTCVIAGFCPMLKVKIVIGLVTYNLFSSDIRLFLITYTLLGLTGFFLFLRKVGAYRFMTIVIAIWSLLMAAAVFFKSSNYFGIKFWDKFLAKAIHFQWGWIVLFLGVVILITSVRKLPVTGEAPKV